MREIKFRAWDTINKKWLWTGFENYTSETHSDKPIGERDGRFWLTPQWTDNSNVIVFLQYTGLKDKNGVDLFEGDIYHMGDRNITYTVVWHDTGLIGKQNSSTSYAGLEHWIEKIEIIGNIYENKGQY